MIKVVKSERVQLAIPPRGKYVGEWSGYVITIVTATDRWVLTTDDGVRGRAGVIVTSDGSNLKVERAQKTYEEP